MGVGDEKTFEAGTRSARDNNGWDIGFGICQSTRHVIGGLCPCGVLCWVFI